MNKYKYQVSKKGIHIEKFKRNEPAHIHLGIMDKSSKFKLNPTLKKFKVYAEKEIKAYEKFIKMCEKKIKELRIVAK